MEETNLQVLNEKIWAAGQQKDDLVQRVTNALRHQIVSGRILPGARFAPEAVLAKGLGISRPSLREAIRVLSSEGLLEVKHGVGTFVVSQPKTMLCPLELIRSMTEVIRAAGASPSTEDLSVSLVYPPLEIGKFLKLNNQQVAMVSRIRLIDGQRFGLAKEYVALKRPTRDLKRFETFDGGSLYDFLRLSLDRPVAHSRVWMSAAAADSSMAKVLGVVKNTPLLVMRELHFDHDDQPCLYSINWHNTAVIEFAAIRSGFPM